MGGGGGGEVRGDGEGEGEGEEEMEMDSKSGGWMRGRLRIGEEEEVGGESIPSIRFVGYGYPDEVKFTSV